VSSHHPSSVEAAGLGILLVFVYFYLLFCCCNFLFGPLSPNFFAVVVGGVLSLRIFYVGFDRNGLVSRLLCDNLLRCWCVTFQPRVSEGLLPKFLVFMAAQRGRLGSLDGPGQFIDPFPTFRLICQHRCLVVSGLLFGLPTHFRSYYVVIPSLFPQFAYKKKKKNTIPTLGPSLGLVLG
jgi:hypothetical protein